MAVMFLLFVFSLLLFGHAENNSLQERIAHIEHLFEQTAQANQQLQQQNQISEQEIQSLRSRLQALETSCLTDHTAVKRSDDATDLQIVVENMATQLSELSASVTALKTNMADQQAALLAGSASVFTRWGHRACPAGTDLVYSGYVGGAHSETSGAAANYLCLPMEPEFDDDKRLDDLAQLYGGEYHTYGEPTYQMDAVCSVCRSPRASVVMVPAANHCWEGWTLEYNGHLMAGRPDHAAASEFVCVDKALQSYSTRQRNENGKLLYYTATHCGSLPCPPYADQKIVSCSVCTK